MKNCGSEEFPGTNKRAQIKMAPLLGPSSKRQKVGSVRKGNGICHSARNGNSGSDAENRREWSCLVCGLFSINHRSISRAKACKFSDPNHAAGQVKDHKGFSGDLSESRNGFPGIDRNAEVHTNAHSMHSATRQLKCQARRGFWPIRAMDSEFLAVSRHRAQLPG